VEVTVKAPALLIAVLLTTGCGGSDPTPPAQWRFTCGDPVCAGHRPDPAVPTCGAAEQAGEACSTLDARCDPVDDCNRRLVCTTEDPTGGPGGCPISRAAAKRDVEHLDPRQVRALRDALVSVRLASWRYHRDPADVRRLGFVIEDGVPPAAVTPDGGHVDLYGYASLAVAAVQEQQREIDGLKRELAALRAMIARDGGAAAIPGR
jgi:hypothetical protein